MSSTNRWPSHSIGLMSSTNGWPSHSIVWCLLTNWSLSHSNGLIFPRNGWQSHLNHLMFLANRWPSHLNGWQTACKMHKWKAIWKQKAVRVFFPCKVTSKGQCPWLESWIKVTAKLTVNAIQQVKTTYWVQMKWKNRKNQSNFLNTPATYSQDQRATDYINE